MEENQTEIETYRDLLERLKTFTPEQLNQKVQIIPPGCMNEECVPLCPVIGVASVGYYFDTGEDKPARSSFNNRFNPEEMVLLTDSNLFDENGVFAVEIGEDGDYACTVVEEDGSLRHLPENERYLVQPNPPFEDDKEDD